MPTRNVNLTDDQDAFVEKMVKAGKYQNASEAMRDAVRGLQQRWKEDEAYDVGQNRHQRPSR